MEQIIERLYRRLQLMVGRGRVTYVDDTGPIQMAQIRASALELADKRPRVQSFGHTSNPPAGSDAMMVAVAGDRSAMAVIGTNHQESRPRGLAPGESMLYSQDGKHVYLTAAGGIVVEAKGQDVVVNNAKDVTWNLSGKLTITAPGGVVFDTPTLVSTGDIQDNSATTGKTMANMRQLYDEHTHEIEEIETGSSTVTSNTPTPQE